MLPPPSMPPCDSILQVLYPFEGNGLDFSGNGNDGVLTGAATALGALHIPKDDSSALEIPEALLNGVGDFTITFRIRFDGFHYSGYAPYNYILSVYNNNNAFGFGYVRNENHFRVHLQDEYNFDLPELLDSTVWYCMAVQREANILRYFIDGEQTGGDVPAPSDPIEVAPDGLVLGQDRDCYFGCYAENQSMFGDLDNFRIYHRVLSAEELAEFCTPTYLSVTACEGEAYDNYGQSGIYEENFISPEGCDSIRILDLDFTGSVFGQESVGICGGESYAGHSETGIYIDTLVAANGCDSIRELNLIVTEGGTFYIDTTICVEQAYYRYNAPGTYVDSFVNSYGCDSIRILNLDVIPLEPLYIQTAFSPNFDGVNDHFLVQAAPELEVQLKTLRIFSRWGELVYEIQNPALNANLWDGRLGSQPAPDGVYVYLLEYECNGLKRLEQGSVQLIK
ncbi:MAG: gliding motility-associated C-terminal domain-containing protein [Phaeodactylibacter sp.]|nr:gliding motility-associated C-terminal domain-containing protein [Phaeodactylibacter sp.]